MYRAEEADAAILSFTYVASYPAKLIIQRLAENHYNRITHEAFWIGQGLENATPSC
ncbi:MAG: hypothetical protein ACI9RO_001709 [Alteromonas macleodii]